MSASDYCELAVLNSLFGKTSNFGALASRPTLYVALCTSAPTDASTGSTIVEATYTGYARVSTATSDWNAASGTSPSTVTNANPIAFGACTAGSSTVTHFALVDAASAGNVIIWGALNSSLAVSSGITPSFAASQISTTAD